jgi:hypothetical protein
VLLRRYVYPHHTSVCVKIRRNHSDCEAGTPLRSLGGTVLVVLSGTFTIPSHGALLLTVLHYVTPQ